MVSQFIMMSLKKTINFVDGKLNLDDSYYDFCRSVNRSYSDKLNEIFKIGERESNQNLDLDTPNFKQYANIASSAQKIVENLLKKIFLFAHEITKEKRFIFSGGVAMNSVAINGLSKLDFVEEIIIPPSPGDSGAAIGAAYYGYLKNGNEFHTNNNDIDILSPGLVKNKKTDEEFFLTNYDKICDHNNLIETASELIISNESYSNLL
jgi:predicted NodU family carbamoyl transferase